MADDVLNHFASNSSNLSDQSLPTKIAKLEARMIGKGPPAPSPALRSALPIPSPSKLSLSEDLLASVSSSDSDDDDNGAAYLIQANILKRQKLNDTVSSTGFDHFEVMGDVKPNSSRTLESKTNSDVNRKKHGRGRGQSISSRGRGPKSDQTKVENSQSVFQSLNGHLDNTDNLLQEQIQDDDRSSLLVELASLRAKLAA